MSLSPIQNTPETPPAYPFQGSNTESDSTLKRKLSVPDSFERPLKSRKFTQTAPELLEQIASCHLDESVHASCEKKKSIDLTTLYGIDFEKPPITGNKNHFFQLRDQLLLIENYCQKNAHNIDIHTVRKHVNQIIHSVVRSHANKMAELGMIFYFIERDRALPDLTEIISFTTYRRDEVGREILALKQQYKKNCPQKIEQISSCKNNYILNTFVDMLLTTDQKVNLGGLYALISILNSADARIICQLQPEHRDHLLVVLNQILTKPHLQMLIEQEINVHADMALLIRLDLKLAKDTPLRSQQTMKACLMALFFDIRQHYIDVNCYAVSTLIYSTQTNTYKVLNVLIGWLTQGHCVSNSVAIPLLPLVAKRLVCENDLQVQLPVADTLNLTAFMKIFEVMEIENSHFPLDAMTKTQTLEVTLQNKVQSRKNEDDLLYSKKIYEALKHNCLSKMMLAAIEMHEVNITEEETLHIDGSLKQKFIDVLIEPLKYLVCPAFFKLCRETIERNLWLENHSEKHVNIKNGSLFVGPSHAQKKITGTSFELKALKILWQQSQLIFSVDQGKYQLIETYTELQNLILKYVREIASQLLYTKQKTQLIERLVATKAYLRPIAHYCASEIAQITRNHDLSGDQLLDRDLLLLIQKGGYADQCIRLFGLHNKVAYWESSNAYFCLKNLYYAFKEIDGSILEQSPVFHLESATHAYTMNPKKCNQIWKDNTNSREFMERTIFLPARLYLNRTIPRWLTNTIINRCAHKGFDIERIRNFFKKEKHLTYSDFRTLLLNVVHSHCSHKDRSLLELIIDEEYYKLTLTRQQIGLIFKKLNLNVDKAFSASIHKALIQKYHRNTDIYRIASFLRKVLIQKTCAIVDPHVLETAICEVVGLPIAFVLGDLNHRSTDKDNAAHLEWRVRYNFGQKKICYYERRQFCERLQDNARYSSITLMYPGF